MEADWKLVSTWLSTGAAHGTIGLALMSETLATAEVQKRVTPWTAACNERVHTSVMEQVLESMTTWS